MGFCLVGLFSVSTLVGACFQHRWVFQHIGFPIWGEAERNVYLYNVLFKFCSRDFAMCVCLKFKGGVELNTFLFLISAVKFYI